MKKKLFIPRKIDGEDSRYSEWNKQQPIVDGVQINQYDPEGNREGYWEYYYDTGELEAKGLYVNGKLDGVWEWYYNFDGFLYSIETFKGGVRNGLCEWYNITGELRNKIYFKDGQREGILDFIIRKINNWRNGK